jgi:hypothetical protein
MESCKEFILNSPIYVVRDQIRSFLDCYIEAEFQGIACGIDYSKILETSLEPISFPIEANGQVLGKIDINALSNTTSTLNIQISFENPSPENEKMIKGLLKYVAGLSGKGTYDSGDLKVRRGPKGVSKNERETILSDWKKVKDEGGKQSVFCKQKGISPSTLRSWIKKYIQQ